MFPVAYCLMTRKTADAYMAVFKFIEDKLFKLNPNMIMTDYEDGLRLVIRNYWRNVVIKGCWFHLKRAIHKKCISFGLKKFLQENVDARTLKTMLVNLPLLPEDRLLEGYESIKNFARKKKLERRFAKVFSYFESYWLKQVRFIFIITLINNKIDRPVLTFYKE